MAPRLPKFSEQEQAILAAVVSHRFAISLLNYDSYVTKGSPNLDVLDHYIAMLDQAWEAREIIRKRFKINC